MYSSGFSIPSFLRVSKIEEPPLDIVAYSQCSYIFKMLAFPSISPSNPGSNGKTTTTLNFSPLSYAYLILDTIA